MPSSLKKLTPNLVVSDVARSAAFYHDVLGFSVETTVPEAVPYVFAILRLGAIEIFLNALDAAAAEYPAFAGRPIGGTLTLFIEVEGIHLLHASLEPRVTIVMPLEKKSYGLTEFAFEDPDGYIVTLAEREPA
jgi:catechol 2,3-dioxygenase-like lactoylglutathione lyase family enzyme